MFLTLPKTKFNFFPYIYFIVCKCIQFGQVYSMLFDKLSNCSISQQTRRGGSKIQLLRSCCQIWYQHCEHKLYMHRVTLPVSISIQFKTMNHLKQYTFTFLPLYQKLHSSFPWQKNIICFNNLQVRMFLKIIWEKDKILNINISSFLYYVFPSQSSTDFVISTTVCLFVCLFDVYRYFICCL